MLDDVYVLVGIDDEATDVILVSDLLDVERSVDGITVVEYEVVPVLKRQLLCVWNRLVNKWDTFHNSKQKVLWTF